MGTLRPITPLADGTAVMNVSTAGTPLKGWIGREILWSLMTCSTVRGRGMDEGGRDIQGNVQEVEETIA